MNVVDAFREMTQGLGTRAQENNIKYLQFVINSDIVLKPDVDFSDTPTFYYVDLPKGLEKNNLLDPEEIVNSFKNNETVRELQLVYNPNSDISPGALFLKLSFFIHENNITLPEVTSDQLIDPSYIRNFNSFNMTCYQSVLGMVYEVRKELDFALPIAEDIDNYFELELDKLVESFIKKQNSFVMDHFVNYDAMLARKKDKVIDLLRSHPDYKHLYNDLQDRRFQTLLNLVSFKVKNLLKLICSYEPYLYTLPFRKIVGLRLLVMFGLDELMMEFGLKVCRQ